MSFKRRFEGLKNLCQGIALLGEHTTRSLDAIASVGERLSSLILAEALEQRVFRWNLSTHEALSSRAINLPLQRLSSDIEVKIKEILPPIVQSGKIPVTQGFIGSTLKGVTSTLGRAGRIIPHPLSDPHSVRKRFKSGRTSTAC